MKPEILLILLFVLTSCSKDDPKPPMPAQLLFPLKNSECTTGQTVSGSSTTLVEFKWEASANTQSYELRVTNLVTNITQTIAAKSTSAQLPIEKGTPYSWLVVSKNSKVRETAQSSAWLFYNAGAATSYAPFPAAVIGPKIGATVAKDINNEVLLDWEGADVDNDLAGYEVYFSTETPPTTLIGTLSPGASELKVSVASNTAYYWTIVTFDREGNTATNAISEFKVH